MLKKIFSSFFPDKFYVFSSLDEAKNTVPEGKGIRVNLENQEVCLTRNGEVFFAFINKCPHRQLPLHQGVLENNNWVCPFHRYCFNLESGKNMTVDHKDRLILLKTGTDSKGVFIVLNK
jgi:nitrite reductase/ring-hydroxylating ferredoxin subunit